MINNSKKRIEKDKESIRKFQAETDRRARDLKMKILKDQAKVKKLLQDRR